MTIEYDMITERIYATTAMATLNPDCRCALLHPDHAPALKVLVRDTLSIIVAAIPKYLFKSVDYTDHGIDLKLSIDSSDDETARNALISTAATLIITQIKIAASDNASLIVSLAASFPDIINSFIDFISPAHARAFIKKHF